MSRPSQRPDEPSLWVTIVATGGRGAASTEIFHSQIGEVFALTDQTRGAYPPNAHALVVPRSGTSSFSGGPIAVEEHLNELQGAGLTYDSGFHWGTTADGVGVVFALDNIGEIVVPATGNAIRMTYIREVNGATTRTLTGADGADLIEVLAMHRPVARFQVEKATGGLVRTVAIPSRLASYGCRIEATGSVPAYTALVLHEKLADDSAVRRLGALPLRKVTAALNASRQTSSSGTILAI